MRSASRKPDAAFQWYRDQHRFNGILDAQIAATQGLNEAERIGKIEAALRRKLNRKSLRDFGTWARWFAISERLRRYQVPRPGAPKNTPKPESAERPSTAIRTPPADAADSYLPARPQPQPVADPEPPPPDPEPPPAPPEQQQTRVVARKAPKPTRGRKLNSRLGRARSGKRKLG